jgi:hypothetical protein
MLPAPSPACGGGSGWGRSANEGGDGTEEKQAALFYVKRFTPSPPNSSVALLAADAPPGFPLLKRKDCAWSSRAMPPAPSPACGGGRVGRSANKGGTKKRAAPFHVKRFTPSPPNSSIVPLAADTPPGFPLPKGKDCAWSSRAMLPAPSPACGGRVGMGAAPQTKTEMGPKKNERPVSRETLYAVAAEFFRRASRRRYAARIPSAAGVKPSRRPACPTVRGRAASSFERASLESPGTSA